MCCVVVLVLLALLAVLAVLAVRKVLAKVVSVISSAALIAPLNYYRFQRGPTKLSRGLPTRVVQEGEGQKP